MEKRFIEPPFITVIQDTCSDCELCIRICPTRNFRLSNDALRKATMVHHPEECVLCGQCLCVCPTNSIIHSGFEPSNFKRIKNKKPVTPEVAFEFLSQRRSVRNYSKETPTAELLEKIVQIAGFAPRKPTSQSWMGSQHDNSIWRRKYEDSPGFNSRLYPEGC